jgi:hypothetical protein
MIQKQLENVKIIVTDSNMEIANYVTGEPVVVQHFLQTLEPDRLSELDRTLQIGAICLQKAQLANDIDFVNMRVDKMLFDFENGLKALPDALSQKLGVQHGGVLFPVAKLVEDVKKDVAESLKSVRAGVDPRDPSSALAQALSSIGNLLDPKRTDSVQHKLQTAIEKFAAQDGDLAKTMGLVVGDAVTHAVRPLKDRLAEMEKQLVDQKRFAELVQATTLKGVDFEHELEIKLATLADAIGADLQYVGGDNKAGDFVLKLRPDGISAIDLTIVIEAKNQQTAKGRVPVKDAIGKAMAHRGAQVGIYVVKEEGGLAAEISNFHHGDSEHGTYFACAADNVGFMLRLAIFVARLRAKRDQETVDEAYVQNQVEAIRTALKKFSNLQKSAGAIAGLAEEVKTQLRQIKADIEHSACSIEGSLKQPDRA